MCNVYNFNTFVKCVICFSIEKDFLDSLPLSQQCTEEEEELLHFLFENKLKKVEKEGFIGCLSILLPHTGAETLTLSSSPV